MITKSWLNKESDGVLPPTDDNICKAKEFVFEKWKERAVERGINEPTDLSSSCKFCSLFVKQVFGGRIRGNYDHEHNVIEGKIIDLSCDSEDVSKLDNPYWHDRTHMGCRDHIETLKSCMPRVNEWVDGFTKKMVEESDAEMHLTF